MHAHSQRIACLPFFSASKLYLEFNFSPHTIKQFPPKCTFLAFEITQRTPFRQIWGVGVWMKCPQCRTGARLSPTSWLLRTLLFLPTSLHFAPIFPPSTLFLGLFPFSPPLISASMASTKSTNLLNLILSSSVLPKPKRCCLKRVFNCWVFTT